MRTKKYALLTLWLHKQNEDKIHLSFEALNRITTLPQSACTTGRRGQIV